MFYITIRSEISLHKTRDLWVDPRYFFMINIATFADQFSAQPDIVWSGHDKNTSNLTAFTRRSTFI